ncbi:MerR family transcriptional regulator [Arthrobacter sp. H41]|uniref:MerR family transcriptional regulator n=1 Tax=Arthrobacter sp. H41 TaxID=1312978 RepID=UPI000676AC54|nr:MerR family transcriptional regulator [Arthrobacter sp. H41]
MVEYEIDVEGRTVVVHIGELAERSNLSLRTIRHYDEVGLLHPSARTEGGFRVYSEDDYERLMLIRQARALAFSLEEIGELLAVLATRSGYHGLVHLDLMETVLDEAQRRRTKLAADLDRADSLINPITLHLRERGSLHMTGQG